MKKDKFGKISIVFGILSFLGSLGFFGRLEVERIIFFDVPKTNVEIGAILLGIWLVIFGIYTLKGKK